MSTNSRFAKWLRDEGCTVINGGYTEYCGWQCHIFSNRIEVNSHLDGQWIIHNRTDFEYWLKHARKHPVPKNWLEIMHH